MHGILSKEHIGFRFTAAQLRRVAKAAGHTLSEGVVSGFIVRARNKGMIDTVGLEPNHRNKSVVIYKLVSKEAWNFHGPGIGSIAGRSVNQNPMDQASLPFEPFPNGTHPMVVAAEAQAELDEAAPETGDITLMEYETGGLADQLMELAIKVNELESKPQKTLADFSTDELIEELKLRVK